MARHHQHGIRWRGQLSWNVLQRAFHQVEMRAHGALHVRPGTAAMGEEIDRLPHRPHCNWCVIFPRTAGSSCASNAQMASVHTIIAPLGRSKIAESTSPTA